MLLQICALGVTMSWDDGSLGARASRPHDDGFPGARASRPHQAWHSLGHLLHLDRPATAPWLSFGPADAVSADRVAACSVGSSAAAKGKGCGRDARAPRPITPPLRRNRARRRLTRLGGVWRATSQKAELHPVGNSRLPASRPPPAGRMPRVKQSEIDIPS